MKNYPKGSEWHKWDLQIHVPGSKHADQYSTKDGVDCWDKFIKYIKYSDVLVFGITDYFSISGYETFLSKVSDIAELKEKSFFPCIELRLDISVNSDSEQLQCHLIFDNDCKIEMIKNFLTHLPLKNKKSNGSLAYCTDEDIIACGGYDRVSVTKEELEKTLNNSFGNEKPFFVAGVASGMGSNRPNRNANVKKELADLFDDFCDLFFGNKGNRDYYLKEDRYENKEVKAKTKPVVATSDCHTFDDCENKLGKNFSTKDPNNKDIERSGFSWIKGEPTFEGLKQILYEPSERVSLETSQPEKKPDYQVIESIRIEHKDFPEREISFNQNLNTIIGGRSSGKSVLLGTIAKTIGSDLYVKKKNDRYEEYIEELTKVSFVSWRDGGESTGRDIEYFPQSYINNLAAEEEDTRSLIERTIKNDAYKKDLIEKYNNFCIENRGKINKEVTNYFISNEKYLEKEEETKNKGNKKGIEKEIKKLEVELDLLRKNSGTTISEEELKDFDKLADENEVRREENDNYINKNVELEHIKEEEIFISLDDLYISDELSQTINKLFEDIKLEAGEKWKTEIDKLIEKNKTAIDVNNKIIEQVENELIFKKCREYYNSNELLITQEKLIEQERKKLEEITLLEKEKKALVKRLSEIRTNILTLHNKYYEEADLILGELEYTKDEVSISPHNRFKGVEFSDTLAERFNQKSDAIKNLVRYEYTNNDDYKNFMENKIFDSLLKEEITLKGYANVQQVITDIFSKNYYDIGYDVTYQGDKLSEMSEGKKAFIILRLLLDFNNKECPILIDQPEDDLDNRAVFNELVEYLRKKKKERQIILVTHNPNIVVGADAEEVIVANQNGTGNINIGGVKFNYISGALEETFIDLTKDTVLESKGIKEHVCEILEGGDKAFIKREKKYGFAN